MTTESEFDTTLKIRSLEKQVEYYKSAFKRAQSWRWVCYVSLLNMCIVLFCCMDSIIYGN